MSKTNEKGTVQIYTDGGARGNPGPAGIGVVLFDGSGKKLEEISKYIGSATNNVAEYLAVIYGLTEALFKGAGNVILNVDSQLVAKQLKGEYKVKDQNIRKYCGIALNLFRGFDKVEVKEIPREKNKEADTLVNKAINLESLL
ncbi:MAG: ribonuclease HI family protein [Candidatus Omnitrophota bacterium]